MNISALIYGTIAGILGAVLWAAIAYYGNVEIGWIAWGIGAAIGFAVSVGSRENGAGPATIAVIITCLSLCGGKYLAVQFAVGDLDAQINELIQIDEDSCISTIAFEIAEEQEAKGELEWPEGVDFDSAELEDLPEDIIDDANAQWDAKSRDEKDAYMKDIEDQMKNAFGDFKDEMVKDGFLQSFSFFDVIFFLLGIFTAGKLAYEDVVQ